MNVVLRMPSLFRILIFFAIVFFLSDKNSFSQAETLPVSGMDDELLQHPWAGGMNSIQFGEIDLNLDGIPDLVAYDRQGNRFMCFLNGGEPGKTDYHFAPEYSKLLPEISDWVIFADYNFDGKQDLFTYSPGWAGMKVYKNISDQVLKFELVVYPYLKSYQGGGYVNLLVTSADYPGIADIDGDGDLDILSFWGLGSFLNYHKNLSVEKYGHADSLDYELTEYCWGRFAESDESNEIFLDTCLNGFSNQTAVAKKERHTGSTLLLIDLDDDGDKDLLLGDIGFPGLWSLTNAGNSEFALIGSVDTLFPQPNEQAKLFSMPAAASIDVNNDSKPDLLVSPFDPSDNVSENLESVWLYLNYSENNIPNYQLESKNFLQSQMIDRGSGAYPLFFDWDQDGLTDFFVGNYGVYLYSYYYQSILHSVYISEIAFYKNSGTAGNPHYKLSTTDFAELRNLNLVGIYPAFAELSGDDLTDLLFGNSNGNLLLAVNKGNDSFKIENENYFSIDVGDFSTPQLFDIDQDGLLDLLIGEKNGNINYYRNQGTIEQPDFNFVTDSLGKINVTDYTQSYTGYSTPCFFRQPGGETGLVIGSESGKLFYYTNIDGNLDGRFTMSDGLPALLDTTDISFDRGERTSASIIYSESTDRYEMLAGNFSGGLEFFNGNAEVEPGMPETFLTANETLIISPNPANDHIIIENQSLDGIYFYEIFRINGSEMMNGTLNCHKHEALKLTIQSLPQGLYVIRLSNSKNSVSGKFLVH